ncbi:DNA polymerase III subunit alpha [Thomasclavelia cocleata]|uniref:DNA-directed DNA polymerase n=1 Tax=Thomasclavelia cocleata TaxID=69824 RepID=A0A1I0H646_9FIRM|nr:DNA polymerase III subunit alpha [Thomasclavelia cocleata]MCR1959686.1 DNA polymerase III subunit alpha [Thomasclavelia cocleata]NDO41121.1 DNA polymerase III subunit alpha [Thomasclavelia cocleata]PJN81645.1 DNA polymerase III subunit alpha [Thomasclavelia cocleata]SET79205.1 DNA polymerase III catalytic subunit, DnaE type [Thomasclavelia cocleata]
MLGHLQVYSAYSFQNSTILIEDLCKKASDLHYEALALTDKDNMFGVMEFTRSCQKYGIKPIYGLEASVEIDHEIYPLLLLAKDTIGYFNLVKITSIISLSDNKAITLENLSRYQEHLFVLSACKEGIIERLLLKELESEVLKYLRLFKNSFKFFYVCLQNHGLAMQKKINERLSALALLENIPVCVSNEVRYLESKDAYTLELLQAFTKGVTLDINHELITDQLYLKSSYEMESSFDKKYIENTNYIVTMCNVTIPTHQMHLPKYPIPKNGNTSEYLRQLCIVGLKKRFKGEDVDPKYLKRLKKELDVITKMGFDDYFLIVFDYVRYAKVNKILVGPGRGSAAGSLVAYVLGITNVDPLKYDLLFERFLNEERISLPDIDIDFQDDRRDEIVEYVTNKYGQEHVAQIVTFSTYGPKVAIKDLGKVLGVPLPKLELLAKNIPTSYKNRKSAKEVFETSYNFQSMVNKDPALRKIMPAVFMVEKLPRNISTHAAGVVLSSEPLDQIVPLVRGPNEGIITQYSKDYIEEVGLLKMDFLGLKNLTIIDYIIKDIEKNYQIKININEIDLHNKKTYQMISRGDTFGIFQLESPGMKNLLIKMQCDCLDDVIAAIALFRPGAMANIPSYIARKKGQEAITYPLECLKPILESTYGIIIYQEQVMQVARKVAGFSLAKADILRKAMSKKTASLMASMKTDFTNGGIANGFSEEETVKIFNLIEKFANYGFNKSHSVAYGYVAYWLAYLKANYPLEFFSALLSNEQGSDSSKINCIQEGKKYGVKLLPPSINYSIDRFKVEDGNIRFSLLAIKNVGYAGYKAIIEERKKGLFKDIFDFISRMETSKLNSKMIDSLIMAGAFDEFKLNRSTIKENLHKIIEYAKLKNSIGIEEPPILTIVKDNRIKVLEEEKLVLGVYLSMHPIALIKRNFDQRIINISELQNYINRPVQVIMALSRVKVIVDKKGEEMCFIEGYDETGNVDGVVFASSFQVLKRILIRGEIYLIEGKVNFRDKLSLVINQAKNIR